VSRRTSFTMQGDV